MKRLVLYITFLLLVGKFSVEAQRPAMKVGNNPASLNSSAALEVESTEKGFLPPRMTNTQMNAIVNPDQGLIVYCTDCSPVGLRVNNGSNLTPNWQSFGGTGSTNSVIANCTNAGFSSGLYLANTAVSGLNFSVTITNNTFSTVVITFAASDLVLSGLSTLGTLAVGTPTGGTNFSNGQASLTAGQSVTVTYPVTGSPGSCGTLTGVWTKLSLSCTKTVEVLPNINCGGGSWTSAVTPAPSSGLVAGTSYSGTYTIPFSGGVCTLVPESYTVNGLTLAYTGGPVGASGNLTYNLSGIYSGTTGETVLFTTRRGCNAGMCPNFGVLDTQDLDCDGLTNFVDHDDDNDGILDADEQGFGSIVTSSNSGVIVTMPSNISYGFHPWGQQSLQGLVDGVTSMYNLSVSGSYSNQEFIRLELPEQRYLTSFNLTQMNNLLLTAGSVVRIEASNNTATWINLTGDFSWGSSMSPTFNFSSNKGNYKFYRIFAVSVTGGNGGNLAEIAFNQKSLSSLDSDGDGIVNRLDLDSDNDGCLDAVEGSALFTAVNLAGRILSGGINSFGVPLLATGSGQGIGNSQNASVRTCTP